MGASWADWKLKKKKNWSVFSYSTTTNHFSIRLLGVTKSGFYVTASDDALSGWTEKLQSTSQSPTCTRKGSWPLWWSAAQLIHCSFPNPGETTPSEKCAQQTDEKHGKLQHLPLVLVNRMGPILLPTTRFITSVSIEWIGLQSFISSAISPDILPTDYCFFRHLENFLQGKYFHNHQEAENAFPEFIRSWSMDFFCFFFLPYFFLAKMCWLWWFLFWLIMMCLSLVIVI